MRSLVAYVLTLLVFGCKAPESAGSGVNRVHVREEVFGFSVRGRPIRGYIAGVGPRTQLLTAAIHGNEPSGVALLDGLLLAIERSPGLLRGRRLIVIPVVNPDGLASRSRNNARGVDLNRNFPSWNWRHAKRHGAHPASEPETAALLHVIRQFRPDRILAVHAPLRMVNFDGPARGLAVAMANACEYDVKASVGYPTPGSLGSYAGHDWQTPTITLELGSDVESSDAWRRFGPAVEAFVRFEQSWPATTRDAVADRQSRAASRTAGR